MYAFFFFRTQHGNEPGHPRTLFPDDVIRNTIGQVGFKINVVNDVLFIYHSLFTLHIYMQYIGYIIYNIIKLNFIMCLS